VHSARDLAARLAGKSASALEEATTETAEASEYAPGAIHALVAELPERQRLALFLRYYADLDYGAIADALEISGGTVGATLNQARENLRRLMTEVTP
jgi:RNA polymerase sigma factor (sigma-70 family)